MWVFLFFDCDDYKVSGELFFVVGYDFELVCGMLFNIGYFDIFDEF